VGKERKHLLLLLISRGLNFENWELETLDTWINSYENEEIQVKLLEALQCFKENK